MDQCDQFLVLGCHFGRSEAPFCYDTSKNKYVKFQKKEIFIDMYRSNDVVQFDKNFIYIRPFVKVGEPSESVKVFKYYLEKTKTDLSKIARFEENGPDKKITSPEINHSMPSSSRLPPSSSSQKKV